MSGDGQAERAERAAKHYRRRLDETRRRLDETAIRLQLLAGRLPDGVDPDSTATENPGPVTALLVVRALRFILSGVLTGVSTPDMVLL